MDKRENTKDPKEGLQILHERTFIETSEKRQGSALRVLGIGASRPHLPSSKRSTGDKSIMVYVIIDSLVVILISIIYLFATDYNNLLLMCCMFSTVNEKKIL